MNPDIHQLNQNFAFQDGVNGIHFRVGEGDIPVVQIHNQQASAIISLQGAHMLSWIPSGEREAIWLSSDARFEHGKSLRGGIPVCWPWFGASEVDESFPAHGFARTVMWQVTEVKKLSDDETQVVFELDTAELGEPYHHMWPMRTVLEYRITVGNRLKLELITHNRSNQTIKISQALHTYFRVDDVRKTVIYGLEDREYLDKTLGFKRSKQSGSITIDREVDRIYLDTTDDVSIDDHERKINITKQGSQSTVVWNPWHEVASKMGDLGEDGYLNMLCVETANAAEDTIGIRPEEQHTLSVIYSISKL